ncbi:HlyD family type I secretion periplasmic adaptor subunit, partial [Morganella morganii]
NLILSDAFDFARYGYLIGKVKDINLDAIENQQLGLVFNVINLIEKNKLSIGNKNIPLSSGMAVIAEIKTGMRSIISYLLSPLEESVTESLRER